MAQNYDLQLLTPNANGLTVPMVGVWVQLVNNDTGTSFVSTGITNGTGKATFVPKPPGDSYIINTSATSNSGPWTAFGVSNHAVPVIQGDSPAFQGVTTVVGGPYVPSANALPGGSAATKYIIAPPPNGTDDTANLLAAGVALGNVWLKLQPGTYIVSNFFDLLSNTTIEGCGIDATTIQIKSGSFSAFGFAYIFQCKNQIVTNASCHIRDLTLDGNMRSGTAAANQGGLCLPGNYWTIERVRFYDSSYFKLFLGSVTNCRVKNCRFEGQSRGTDTIGGGGNTECLVESCYFASTNDGNLLDFYGADSGFIYRNNFSDLTNSFFLEGSTDALIEGNYLAGGISILSNSRLAPTTNQNPLGVRIINNELNLAGLAGSSGIQIRYDDAAGATTHLAGGGNTIANNLIRNPAKVGILIFGQADTWKTRADVVVGNKIFNPNTDGTNTINTGFAVHNNAGIVLGVGAGDTCIGNSVTEDRGGSAKMQYGYCFGASAATTLTKTAFLGNTSVGHLTAMSINAGGYTALGPNVILDTGELDITTNGQNQSLVITDLGGNGAGFKLTGAGTPASKYVRVHPGTGDWEMLDSAHNNVIYGMNDKGGILLKADLKRSRQTPTETVLVSGVDATAGEIISVTLTAARVVGAPLNPVTGQNLTFELTQGGVGAFAVTWNAVFKKTWADTGNATGKISSITFYYNGTNWVQTGAQAPYV